MRGSECRVTEAGQRNLKLLIAGGGTGGHVFPALAVAREWMTRGQERKVVFVGTQRGIEARLVPEAGFPLEIIRSAGLKGIGGMKFARNLAKLAPAMWDALAHSRRTVPHLDYRRKPGSPRDQPHAGGLRGLAGHEQESHLVRSPDRRTRL